MAVMSIASMASAAASSIAERRSTASTSPEMTTCSGPGFASEVFSANVGSISGTKSLVDWPFFSAPTSRRETPGNM